MPPASEVLDWGQYEGTRNRKTTYERKKPSGAIIRLEIVRLVTGPTTLGSRGRGLVWERAKMDTAWAIEKNEKVNIKEVYIIMLAAQWRLSEEDRRMNG